MWDHSTIGSHQYIVFDRDWLRLGPNYDILSHALLYNEVCSNTKWLKSIQLELYVVKLITGVGDKVSGLWEMFLHQNWDIVGILFLIII